MKAPRYIISLLILIAMAGTGSAQEFNSFTSENSELPNNVVRSVLVDHIGAKWFGTANGLSRYDGSSWATYTTEEQLAGNTVTDIAFEQTTHGPEIWVTTTNGVSVMNVTPDAISVATPYQTENTDLVSNNVTTVAVDSSHVRWFGTDNGVSSFLGSEWTVYTDMVFPDGITVYDIDFDDEIHYFATGTMGVLRTMETVDGVSAASTVDTEWSQLPSDMVISILTASDGSRWYGTDAGIGVHTGDNVKINWTIFDVQNGSLPGDMVYDIFEQSDGTIWVATDNGAAMFSQGAWESFTSLGAITFDEVYDIDEGKDGSMWFGTDNGVVQYAPVQTIVESDISVPSTVSIAGVFPNPFNPATTIEYTLEQAEFVEISVYNLAGQKIRQLVSTPVAGGIHQVVWNGRDDSGMMVSSGLYITRLTTETSVASARMMLMK